VRTGISSLADVLVSASVVLTAAIICAGGASADPSQQDQFVALLEQDQIPLIDNLPALVARAHQICRKRRDERYFRGQSGLPPRFGPG
jgi:hypothetical protein